MGSKGGGGGTGYTPQSTNTSQVTNTAPWAQQQPYLAEVFNQALGQYNVPMQFYGGAVPGVTPGQTYAPFSPETLTATGMTEAQALNDPTVAAAQNYSTNLLGGNFLMAGNPYFSNMVRNIQQTVAPQVESQFSGAGRYGSGAMDRALASAVTDTAGNLAYQNYANVLEQMGKGLYTAPQTAQLGYLPAQELSGVGAQMENQTQNAINQAMQSWQFQQMEPWQRMGLLNNMIQGNYGGTSVSTGTGQQLVPRVNQNTFGNVFGGLSSLGGLGLLAYSML